MASNDNLPPGVSVMDENINPTGECNHEYEFRRYCGAWVCPHCDQHRGLERCFCGWSLTYTGHGRQELIDMGENIE